MPELSFQRSRIMDNRTKENAVEKVVRAMSQIPGISDLMQEKVGV